jgi:protein-S-isoprenylcysteine O-methyltransferase Ste14
LTAEGIDPSQNENVAGAERKHILPPTCFFLAILAIVLLHILLPLKPVLAMPWGLIGILPLVVGLWANVWASNAFNRANTTVKPYEESTRLVTDGFYRFTRHPMYVGMTASVLGLALLLGSLGPLVMRRFMLLEEAAMERTFADEYRAYCRRVRRWL